MIPDHQPDNPGQPAPTDPSVPGASPRAIGRSLPSLLLPALLVFVAGCWLFSRDLGFSWHFHADEGGKILQIQHGERNFHHPLLLLHLTGTTLGILGNPADPHDIVLAGRWVSVAAMAAACAIAVAALALVRGPFWGVALGVLLLAHPATFTYARFFKEDPLLLAGLSVCLLGLALAAAGRWRPGWITLGIGLGLGIGGKYVGALWWPFFLAALAGLAGKPGQRRTGLAGALLLGLGLFALIQLPGWIRPGAVADALADEVAKATRPGRVTGDTTPTYQLYWKSIARPPHLFLAATALAGMAAAAWKRRWPWFCAGLSCWVYLAVLCTATKEADRYLLPWHFGICISSVAFIAACADALGPPIARRFLRPGFPSGMAAGALCALPFFAATLPDLLAARKTAVESFRNHRHRTALFDFLRENLPADALVIYGTRVGLPDPAYPRQYPPDIAFLPQRVRFEPWPWEFRSAANMRAQGITHFVTSEEFDRMEKSSKREGKREFFKDFRAHSRVVFSSERGGRSQFPMRLKVHEILPP